MTRVATPCRRASFRLREPRAFSFCGGFRVVSARAGQARHSSLGAALALSLQFQSPNGSGIIWREFSDTSPRFHGSSSAARQAHGYALAAACCILQWPRSVDLRYRIPRINFSKTAFLSPSQNMPRCSFDHVETVSRQTGRDPREAHRCHAPLRVSARRTPSARKNRSTKKFIGVFKISSWVSEPKKRGRLLSGLPALILHALTCAIWLRFPIKEASAKNLTYVK